MVAIVTKEKLFYNIRRHWGIVVHNHEYDF
jgi:hypothetical protein